MKRITFLFLSVLTFFPLNEANAQFFETAHVCIYNKSGFEINYKVTFHNNEGISRYQEYCPEKSFSKLADGKAIRVYCTNRKIKTVMLSLEFLPPKMIKRRYQKIDFYAFEYEGFCSDENSLTIGSPVDGGYKIYRGKGW